MNFQITPAPTKLIASGTKIDRLGDRLVADPVDQDRDEQPAADRQERQQDEPDDVVAERDQGVAGGEEVDVVVEPDELLLELVLEAQDDRVDRRVDEEDDQEQRARARATARAGRRAGAVRNQAQQPLGEARCSRSPDAGTPTTTMIAVIEPWIHGTLPVRAWRPERAPPAPAGLDRDVRLSRRRRCVWTLSRSDRIESSLDGVLDVVDDRLQERVVHGLRHQVRGVEPEDLGVGEELGRGRLLMSSG